MSDSDSRENDVSGRRRLNAPVLDSETDPLSTSPFEGDLAEELAKAPRVRRLPGLTTYLCAGVVLALGFVIGAQTDRHMGTQASNSAQSGAGAIPGGGMPGGGMRGGGMPGQGGGGQGQGGRGAPGASAGTGGTTGTVQKIAGKTIYVQTANGVVQVKVTGTTKIRILQSGSAKDLKSGTSVVVQGPQAKDGTVTATSVSQGASSSG
ncbi:MAG: hypothetical protein JWP48_7185 [Actinoallomurus sp.]|nr:hypothetical protein [Actinoallomurus sp.]